MPERFFRTGLSRSAIDGRVPRANPAVAFRHEAAGRFLYVRDEPVPEQDGVARSYGMTADGSQAVPSPGAARRTLKQADDAVHDAAASFGS